MTRAQFHRVIDAIEAECDGGHSLRVYLASGEVFKGAIYHNTADHLVRIDHAGANTIPVWVDVAAISAVALEE